MTLIRDGMSLICRKLTLFRDGMTLFRGRLTLFREGLTLIYRQKSLIWSKIELRKAKIGYFEDGAGKLTCQTPHFGCE